MLGLLRIEKILQICKRVEKIENKYNQKIEKKERKVQSKIDKIAGNEKK